MRTKSICIAFLIAAGALVSGCASSPLCGAAGAGLGAYAGHELSHGRTDATIGGAAAGGLVGAAACD